MERLSTRFNDKSAIFVSYLNHNIILLHLEFKCTLEAISLLTLNMGVTKLNINSIFSTLLFKNHILTIKLLFFFVRIMYWLIHGTQLSLFLYVLITILDILCCSIIS